MRSPSFRRTAGAVAAAAALVGAAAFPATAAPSTFGVVNLGDSYSAGIGTGGTTAVPLFPTSPDAPACLQGTGTDHIDKLGDKRRFTVLRDAACSGATTALIAQIAALPTVQPQLAEAELVTLTLGGNDIGWTQIVQACSSLGTPAACDILLTQARERGGILNAAESAGTTIGVIDAVTDAQIVVFGYPHLVDPSGVPGLITPERAAQLNALTDELNAALRSAVEAEGAVFVDVTERFAGHGIGSAEPWIFFDPADPRNANSLHPTERGYLAGYFTALMSSVSPGRLDR